MATLEDGLRTMVRVFRRECHRVLKSERTTIHGADAMLMVLQLAIAEVNKQESGEFAVALSDVLMAWKHLVYDKLHLPLRDSPRPHNYDLIRGAYDSFLKRTNAMDLIDIQCMYTQLKATSDPEEPLSPVQLFHFLSGSPQASEVDKLSGSPQASQADELLGSTQASEVRDSQVPSTPSSSSGPRSTQMVQKALRRVFCSYLSLLVNTKNDLALAHTLDVPSRSLGRMAFTHLKHAARKSNTSLFLAVTSFVRAIQLGGKGYAPAATDPLRKHLKGMSEFVQFMDNLEELLGDNPDPSVAGAQLVAAVRVALVKGRSRGDVVLSEAEETSRDLTETIQLLHQAQRREASSVTDISPARPKHHVINHATAYGGRQTVKVLVALLDQEALAPPCRNSADLLSEDQAVLTGAEPTCLLSLFRSPEVPSGSSPKPLATRVKDSLLPKIEKRPGIRSQFACTYRDDELPLSRVLDFPSSSQMPTCMHPAPKRTLVPGPEEGPKSTSAMENATGTELSSSTLPGGREGRPDPKLLGQRCGNATSRRAVPGSRKAISQVGSKGGKRKQVDEGNEDGGSENQPPPKKPPATLPSKTSVKNVPKAQSKKKLISGQGKLTSFFRV